MENHILTTDLLTAFGINHWNAPLSVREQFSFSETDRHDFYKKAALLGYSEVILLSTCNRSEVLVYSEKPDEIRELFIRQCRGSADLFSKYGFIKYGDEAAGHFFKVTVGLDSQIPGDLQIIHQVKKAYRFSNRRKMTGKILHRFIQCAFKAHKRIRGETGLASGSATIAYAAIQCIRRCVHSLDDKNIVLVGTGKIGKITCKNLMRFGARNVTLVNRNINRAKQLGDKFNLPVSGFNRISDLMAEADVVIVATDANAPVLNSGNVPESLYGQSRIMIDLSVPRNIDPSLAEQPGIRIINMDMLQDITDEANKRRRENIPGAEEIIEEELKVFREWLDEQKIVPVIYGFQTKLEEIRRAELIRFNNSTGKPNSDTVDLLTNRITKKFLAYSINYIKNSRNEVRINTGLNKNMLQPDKGFF